MLKASIILLANKLKSLKISVLWPVWRNNSRLSNIYYMIEKPNLASFSIFICDTLKSRYLALAITIEMICRLGILRLNGIEGLKH